MRSRLASFVLLAFAVQAAVVLDRIAVIVGKTPIKQSDINRELRITEFLNRQSLDLSAQARKQEADHLVDQAIIREEISLEGYRRATDAQADALFNQIRTNRYAGSDARMREALARYGLNEDQFRAALLWQMTVLDFIDDRFRAGVLVTDDEIRKYYNEHLAALRKQHPRDSSFEALAPSIRTTLSGEQVNQQFDAWLQEARKEHRIEYLEGAFK